MRREFCFCDAGNKVDILFLNEPKNYSDAFKDISLASVCSEREESAQ